MAILAYFADFNGVETFLHRIPISISRDTAEPSLGHAEQEDILWWWQTTREFQDPEGVHPEAQHERGLSPHLSESKMVHLKMVPTSWVHLQSPGVWIFCSPRSNPRQDLRNMGLTFLFKMRTCPPNTTWSPQISHTTIPPTWEPSDSASSWRWFCSVVRVPLRVYSSLSTLSSMPHDLPPPAAVAIWVSMTSPHSLALPIHQTVYWAPEVYPSFNHHKNSVPMSQMKRVRWQMKWRAQVLPVHYDLNLN